MAEVIYACGHFGQRNIGETTIYHISEIIYYLDRKRLWIIIGNTEKHTKVRTLGNSGEFSGHKS